MRFPTPRSLLLGLLLSSLQAQADPPDEQARGDLLVEDLNSESTLQRLACGSRFCVWLESSFLGPCSSENCNSYSLVVSDLQGRKIPEKKWVGPAPTSKALRGSPTARFLDPLQFELLFSQDVIDHNEGGRPPDLGVSPTVMRRQRMALSKGGSVITSTPMTWASAEWGPRLGQLFSSALRVDKPRLQSPVSKALLAKAQAVCLAEHPGRSFTPWHHECHAGACVLILHAPAAEVRDGSRDESLCWMMVKGTQIQQPSLEHVGPSDGLSLRASGYCFEEANGGIRGSGPGDEQCISRDQPGRLAFLPTEGLQLENSVGYPVRKADSLAAALALAPTVHAFTLAQVSWGRQAWKDESDLSLAWQAVRVGEELRLHAEVIDDVLVPLGGGEPGIHTDHLELDFWGPQEDAAWVRTSPVSHLKLGVLLDAEGQVRTRVWKRVANGQDRDVDEPQAATGTWARTEHGYTVDLALPLQPLLTAVNAPRAPGFDMTVSDADGSGKQETLLRNRGSLRLWNEYPPTFAEYSLVIPWR